MTSLISRYIFRTFATLSLLNFLKLRMLGLCPPQMTMCLIFLPIRNYAEPESSRTVVEPSRRPQNLWRHGVWCGNLKVASLFARSLAYPASSRGKSGVFGIVELYFIDTQNIAFLFIVPFKGAALIIWCWQLDCALKWLPIYNYKWWRKGLHNVVHIR